MERYVIHVTKICNMKCLYCYEQDKHSTYEWEEVKTLIDNICEHQKEFSVEFLGGEPMLAFDLIKKSVEYFSTKDVNVIDFIITTNGTILTEDMLDFMRSNPKIYYAVSLDGGYFANQLRLFNNKNSYDVAMSNIKKAIEAIGNNRVSTHIVSHPYNVGLISKSIDLFYHNGIRNIGVGIIEGTMEIGKEFYDEYLVQLKDVSDKVKSGFYKGLSIDELESTAHHKSNKHYMYDENGKLIGESYGRAENDITKQAIYNTRALASERSELITKLRKAVYDYHHQ